VNTGLVSLAPALEAHPSTSAQELVKHQGVGICDLTSKTCRWPLWGDSKRMPVEEQFYCGERALSGHHYCALHARMAYKA
jgi:hypothetical protein